MYKLYFLLYLMVFSWLNNKEMSFQQTLLWKSFSRECHRSVIKILILIQVIQISLFTSCFNKTIQRPLNLAHIKTDYSWPHITCLHLQDRKVYLKKRKKKKKIHILLILLEPKGNHQHPQTVGFPQIIFPIVLFFLNLRGKKGKKKTSYNLSGYINA